MTALIIILSILLAVIIVLLLFAVALYLDYTPKKTTNKTIPLQEKEIDLSEQDLWRLRMDDFFEIKEENIILTGTTHNPWGEHKFIVYMNEDDNRIRVNTDFIKVRKGIYKGCTHYDGGLCDKNGEICDTIDKFREFTISEIEQRAYCVWMTEQDSRPVR